MSGIIPTEVHNLGDSTILKENDKDVRDAIRAVYSRGNFALNSVNVSTTHTIDRRKSIFLCSSTGAYAITLPYANYYGSAKSPILTFIRTSGTDNITLTPQTGDTIDGGSSLILRAGGIIQLVSNGSTGYHSIIEYSTGTTTPTPTGSGSVAFTSAAAVVRWTKNKNRVLYTATVAITTNGAAAGAVIVPMPFTSAETTATTGVDNSNSWALSGFVSGATLSMFKYDGTYPGADGRVLIAQGTYRV